MKNDLLNSVVAIRQSLSAVKHKNGEIAGAIIITELIYPDIVRLVEAGIIDSVIIVQGTAVTVSKLSLTGGKTVPTNLTLFTQHLKGADYFETMDEFVIRNNHSIPVMDYYIHEYGYFSGSLSVPAKVAQYNDTLRLITILASIADYEREVNGEYQEFILFQKRKIVLQTIYNSNHLRHIRFLDDLSNQFENAHDKEERKTIFKAELVSTLHEFPDKLRFSELLMNIEVIYDNYLKSHLLYLEKFSYNDLKSEIDNDILDYTKKIYGTVNDIQAKLISVPAAYLLILSQFDFTGVASFKNILITIGSVLFSVLLEVLLTNQFSVLRYIETEIKHLSDELKNKDTSVDLSGFINSFAGLDKVAGKQRLYLWLFRAIVWSVPVVSVLIILKVQL